MEPQLTIEQIPFVWGLAFSVDLMVGLLTFIIVVRKNVPSWLKSVMTWVGWWSWASALSLIINAIEGPQSTFSYHQIGVFTETMTNIGVIVWGLTYAFRNWYVQDKDWREMDLLRTQITNRNRLKELESDAE